MARKYRISNGGRRTFILTFSSVAFVSGLLYWEQAAILYVLSTVAMCGLLLAVAFSDLESRDKDMGMNGEGAAAGSVGGEARAILTPSRRAGHKITGELNRGADVRLTPAGRSIDSANESIDRI